MTEAFELTAGNLVALVTVEADRWMLRVLDLAHPTEEHRVLVVREMGDAGQSDFLPASFGHRLIESGYMLCAPRWTSVTDNAYLALCERLDTAEAPGEDGGVA